jgi:hypothetical protein
MIFLALWALALLAAAIHVSVRGLWARPLQRVTVFLLYQLGISWGLLGLVVFVGHALRTAETAAQIGWPASPNFQFELGALELGVAFAAGLCLVIRNRYYWLGVIVAPGVLMVLAGLNHLREALQGNLAPYNLGTIAPDLLIPLTAAGLLFRVFRLATTSSEVPSASA